MRVLDCFLYAGEANMLAERARVLDGHVDAHLIVEGRQTMQGHPRHVAPLPDLGTPTFRQTIDLSDGSRDQSFLRTGASLRALTRLLAAHAEPGDTVLLSDVDEIPDPEFIAHARAAVARGETVVCEHDFRMFALDWQYGGRGRWCGTAAVPAVRALEGLGRVRDERGDWRAFEGGWHLSWMGGPAAWREKADSFAHWDCHDLTDADLLDCWLTGHDVAASVEFSRVDPPPLGIASGPWWYRWHEWAPVGVLV